MRQTYQSQITKIDYSKSKNVIFLYLKIDDLNWWFEFKSGQFVVMSTKIWDHVVRRSYSIATTMDYYHQTWEIGIIIKYVPLGLMTTYLLHEAKIGDIMDIVWPVGKMFCDPETEDLNYLLISSGSGLWPIRSIYQHLKKTWKYHNIYQIFWERNTDDILDLEDFTDGEYIYDNWSQKIHNIVTLSRQKIDWYREWYVQSYILWGLSDLNINKLRIYICGKPAMVEEATEILLANGVDKQYIYSEKY